VEGLEQLLKSLIDLSPSEVSEISENNKQILQQITELLVGILEKEQAFKVLETGIDFLEFALSAIPEILLDHIEEVVMVLLK